MALPQEPCFREHKVKDEITYLGPYPIAPGFRGHQGFLVHTRGDETI